MEQSTGVMEKYAHYVGSDEQTRELPRSFKWPGRGHCQKWNWCR